MTDGPRTDDPSDLPTSIDNSKTTLKYMTMLSDAPITESVFNQNTLPLDETTTIERSFTTISSDKTAQSMPSTENSYVKPTTKMIETVFSENKQVSTESIHTTRRDVQGVQMLSTVSQTTFSKKSSTDSQTTFSKRSSRKSLEPTKSSTLHTAATTESKSTTGFQTTNKTKTVPKSPGPKTISLGITKFSSTSSSKLSSQSISLSTTSREISSKFKKPLSFPLLKNGTVYWKTDTFTTPPAFTLSSSPESSISYSNLESTKEPPQTMGAGALVIVVLLPFLALFLIAIVTALRRKMKKSGYRIRRYQNRNADSKYESNQSQVIPLTKIETNN